MWRIEGDLNEAGKVERVGKKRERVKGGFLRADIVYI